MRPNPRFLRPVLLALTLAFSASAHAYLDVQMEEPTARAMLHRFGYGIDPVTLRAAIGTSPRQYIRRAIETKPVYPAAINQHTASLPSAQSLDILWSRYGPGGTEKMIPQSNKVDESGKPQRAQREIVGRQILEAAVETRLLQTANSDNPGHEVLLNFWLNHFSVHGLKTINKFLVADYVETLRQAMYQDSFLALLRASFLHPAMQIYLDNARSTAPNSRMGQNASQRGKMAGLNENLARELLELHTLGINSGYTQADIQALARIITGAGVLNNQMQQQGLTVVGAERIGYFLFDPRRHDFEVKTLLGTNYPAGQGFKEIERALEQLTQHPATANHIAGKLARRFLADEPPPKLVKAMADGFRRSKGKISDTLLPLLNSREFAESLEHPNKFKEPLDYLISATRATCYGQNIGNGKLLLRSATDLEQAPFMRTTPDGYGSQQKDWLSAPAMAKRVRIAQGLASGKLPIGGALEAGRETAFCRPTPENIRRAVGPLSDKTKSALKGLNPQDEMTALLASPEFMNR